MTLFQVMSHSEVWGEFGLIPWDRVKKKKHKKYSHLEENILAGKKVNKQKNVVFYMVTTMGND